MPDNKCNKLKKKLAADRQVKHRLISSIGLGLIQQHDVAATPVCIQAIQLSELYCTQQP